ncbi:MAG: hypothetical protein ACLFTT_02755 [Candidatus Hydrogenedentota bacterium]
MHNKGRAAIKAIVIMGGLAFALLYLGSLALQQSLTPNPQQRVTPRPNASPMNSARAMADFDRFAAWGPRPRGSDALVRQKAYTEAQLRAAQWRIAAAVQAQTNGGEHLLAYRGAKQRAQVLLATRYDTPANTGGKAIGANQTAGAALLLELARALPTDWADGTLWLAWLDTGGDDAAAGRALREALAPHMAERPAAVIYVAGLGDCYLEAPADAAAPAWLRRIVRDTAQRLGYGRHFPDRAAAMQGPHTVFREAGVPSLALIDPVHGGRLFEESAAIEADPRAEVCADSLQAAGDVIYHAIPAVYGYLMRH